MLFNIYIVSFLIFIKYFYINKIYFLYIFIQKIDLRKFGIPPVVDTQIIFIYLVFIYSFYKI